MKFNVTVFELHSVEVTVDALSPTEARQMVAKLMEDDDECVGEDAFEYYRTLDTDEWTVEKV
jgi:hypothetical protein